MNIELQQITDNINKHLVTAKY